MRTASTCSRMWEVEDSMVDSLSVMWGRSSIDDTST